LRQEYPQIVASMAVDNQTRRGIAEVLGELTRRAANLPLMGAEWPTTWLNATGAVKAAPDKHITPDQMWQLMAGAGVTDRAQQEYLAVAMHQLGDILYYHDDPELAQTVVLRPEWVNEYISRVLDSHDVAASDGLLTHPVMTALWSDLDRGMRDHFLGMMDKYEISFRVDEGPAGVVSLVVERLPWNPPPYEDAWRPRLSGGSAGEIRVLYQLNPMPPGIPTWFIARSHRFTTNTHWRTGAVLQHPDRSHRALVRANPRRNTVELMVRGPAPAAFFSILDDGFNLTLDRYPGLEIKRLVPCPCQGTEKAPCTELFDYEDLQKRLTRDPPRHEIECRKSGEFLDVPQLLLGLAPSERDTTRAGIERLTSMLDGIVTKMADQAEYTQRMFLKILRATQEQQETRCPSVFAVLPVKSRVLAGSTFELHLYCEEPGAWHPLPGQAGHYQVNEPAEWLRNIAPYLKQLLAVLKHAAPLAGPILGMTIGTMSERLKAEVKR
jgi:internalin A